MRKLAAIVGALIVVAALFVAAVFLASEVGGEIVTLETRGADGARVETRLWVVEHDGYGWLRSGVPDAGWLARIDADPRVRVTRDGETRSYRAVPVRDDPELRDRIHALMREGYDWADRFVSLIRDASLSVPVRLEPVDEAD